MSITPQLDRYLSVRRSLGYDLRTEERRLRRFARFADQEGAPHIDTALFLRDFETERRIAARQAQHCAIQADLWRIDARIAGSDDECD